MTKKKKLTYRESLEVVRDSKYIEAYNKPEAKRNAIEQSMSKVYKRANLFIDYMLEAG